MVGFFAADKENTAAGCSSILRGFRRSQREKDTTAGIVEAYGSLQSPELGSPAFGQRRKKLTVITLCRFSLLAEDWITGVQTIPFKQDML